MENPEDPRLPRLPGRSAEQAFGRRLDPAERRQLLIASAAKLFEEHGFHGTSMRQIADEVGITKAAVYHYVDSKEQILYAIHDAFISTLLADAEAVIREHSHPEHRIRLLVRDIFRAVAHYRPYVRAFFRDYTDLSADWRQLIQEKRDQYEGLVEACLEEGVSTGVFEIVGSPKLAALFLFGACNWTYQWMTPEGSSAPEALADMWSAMLLRAFSPNGSE